MALVSALAVASARVWWVVAYWTPRARVHRERTRALELGAEWQFVRECAADDPWRQQVEQEIAASSVVVPMTADLLAAAVERGVPSSRRWRRRHRRAITRMRAPRGGPIHPVSNAVGGRRRALARTVPVAAAVALGIVAGPAIQHSATHNPATVQPGAAARDFLYHCSQCRPGATGGGLLTASGQRIPVFADQGLPPETRKAIVEYLKKLRAPRDASSR